MGKRRKSKKRKLYKKGKLIESSQASNTVEANKYLALRDSLISIATEQYRFKSVFGRVLVKLDVDDRKKYESQFSWFEKKVLKALEECNLVIYDVQGKDYDPGMAVTPLNIDDFEVDDKLFVKQTIEPIIMQNGNVMRTGTVIVERIK